MPWKDKCPLCGTDEAIFFNDASTKMNTVRCTGGCVEFEIHDAVYGAIDETDYQERLSFVKRAAMRYAGEGRRLSIKSREEFFAIAADQDGLEQ